MSKKSILIKNSNNKKVNKKEIKQGKEKISAGIFPKGKKIVLVCGTLVIVLAIGGTGGYLMWRQATGTNAEGNMAGGFTMPGGMSGNVFTASGITATGMTNENFEVKNLETKLYIEEVYVSNNSEIEEGTPILKISEETLEKARKELEKELLEAELACRAGAIEYEQNKITAQYDYDTAVLGGTQAKDIYEQALSRLSDKVDQAQEALEEAKEQIAEYESALNDNTYLMEYPHEQLKAVYDENLQLLTDKLEEWGVSWEQVTGGNRGNDQSASVLASLYSVLEQNLKEYEEAKESYDTAMEDAGIQVQKLRLNLSTLQADLLTAKEEKEEQEIQTKLTYQTALAKAGQAQKDYETALQKAEAAYEELTNTKEDAEQNLLIFEESIGDGIYHAGNSGTIVMFPYRAEGYLTPDSMVMAYSNKEDLTMTVSVSQYHIFDVQIGDTCSVQFNEYGTYQGTVTDINPISESGSRTAVTYNVTVSLEGDVSALSSNLSANVIFGMGGNIE